MSTQQDLDGNLTQFSKAVVYYRPVNTEATLPDPEKQEIESSAELLDVEELIKQIKDDKLDYPIPLDDSGMDEVRSDRVARLIQNESIQDDWVADLLGIFCESLKGRQRASNKYAMLVYFESGFLLAHVREQTGMSINEDTEDKQIELIRRFLDIDNILSAALFEKRSGGVEFSHFTDSGSESFRQFLGVSEHRLNYRRKNIQILSYYRGRREYDCKFEFSSDEFRDKWLRDEALSFTADKLMFAEDSDTDHSHEIKEIRWGKDTYTSIERFKSEFKQESLSLNIERKKYNDLMSYPDESDTSNSVFDRPAIDKRREVVVEKDDAKTVFEKGETPGSLHVIYANEHMRLDGAFATDIFHDLMKEQDIRLYHPSTPVVADALVISNITFLNVSQSDISEERQEFLEETYQHATGRSGEVVGKMLINSMLHVLTLDLDGALENAITQLINIYSGHPTDGSKFSTKENEGPDLVEYKNRTTLENGDPKEKIADIVSKEKSKQNDRKVILIGFTEQNMRIEGFSSQSWGHDRISDLAKSVKRELDDRNVDYGDFMLQPVDLDEAGTKKVLTGILI